MSNTTKVFQINGHLFVADTVEDAIKLFRKEYPFPNEVEEVQLIRGRNGSSLASIDDCGEGEKILNHYYDQCQDPNYIQSLTINDEPIQVCKEMPPIDLLDDYDAKTINADGEDIA